MEKVVVTCENGIFYVAVSYRNGNFFIYGGELCKRRKAVAFSERMIFET